MGLLRTLFALSVVLDHSPFHQGNLLVGGRLAVQLFYVISGFLISYILNVNDVYRSTGRFYGNRLLRLFPSYLAVAAAALVLNAAANPEFLDVYRRSPNSGDLALVLANLFIFGQDWIMFAGIKSGVLTFTGSFADSDVPLYKGLLVPQAWTLGVELSFYLIAPFILRSMRAVAVLFLASLALRAVLMHMGLAQTDPWTYRFFPLELALFLAGALSHRLLLPLWQRWSARVRYLPEAATALFVVYAIFHFSVTINHNVRDALALAVFAAILPLAFIHQARHRLDKKIGQLSYPIYISHSVAILLVQQAMEKVGVTDALTISALNVLLSLILAAALWWLIDSRIDRVRERVKTADASGAPAGALRA
ncbi:acyltransferase family protein [Bordetella genomosp. 9]|uniref:Acyltransferase n=1 Tax=Bordetella genomosp. 9 TaxID=1416803 RepID=A0A1W6Z4K4_9BORD|nr:acyltransferase [Bordetella genomosp. 9]ARP87743.1 acyltransferase [Bordetella genomosp. 9]ARP91711.1 acyltransferase [Bordetella genomosp. 9]